MTKFENLFENINSVLRVNFEKGDIIKAASETMISMTDTFEMKAKQESFGRKLERAISKQSAFLVNYIAKEKGEATFSQRLLGEIEILTLDGTKKYVIGKKTFLASDSTVMIDFKEDGPKGFLSGEGILQVEVEGTGHLALSAFGKVIKKTLAVDETLVLDSDYLVLREDSLKCTVEKIPFLASGEKHVLKLVGPGTVWYQTKNSNYLMDTSIY